MGPAVLEISIEPSQAWVRVHAKKKLGRASMASLHGAALKILALTHDVATFETRHPDFVKTRRGLRMPLLPTGFDALCWGIIGQQINVKFATSLRRDMIELAGEKIGDMRAHPTPERVADIDLSALTARRYSRSKAEYLTDAAKAVMAGTLQIENLEGSAIAVEKALTAQRGIGTWTARYVLMRGGFADAAPVGDSALATAPAAAAQTARAARQRSDRAADVGLRAASQPRHHGICGRP
jgi:3-methyladenine DNA glycosylase/8-oxoguanine DNA glycosylase